MDKYKSLEEGGDDDPIPVELKPHSDSSALSTDVEYSQMEATIATLRIQEDKRQGSKPPRGGQPLFVDPAGDRYDPKTPLEAVQLRVRSVLDHIAFRIFTIIMILVDVIIVIVDLATKGDKQTLNIVSLFIISYFMVEVVIRIFSKGIRSFFSSWVDVFDCIIVLVSFIFTLLYTTLDPGSLTGYGKLFVVGRLIRIVLVFRLITEKKHVETTARLTVSQNKRRYQKDGFDLDLCYITERVIAMSFPSKGLMALYRNPVEEVARFFEFKHKGHFKIFNLCSERMYNESLFHYSVERIRIDDHNVPILKELLQFARVARAWMEADPENVIAVHCKGGKGRTGTMIATWLVESGTFEQASESLDYFGNRRTDQSVGRKFQGVETPSQSRYVGYFEVCKTQYNGECPPPVKLVLDSIKIINLSGVGRRDGSDLLCKVITDGKIWEYKFGSQQECKVCLTENL